jgi:tRNA pseudouridine55 synthase
VPTPAPSSDPTSEGSPAEASGNGILLIDKPAGVTSHDVVARCRRERHQRAGHAGTLDPFATGLLLVLLGRATRLQRYLLPLPKTYRATARLGWTSTTGDPDGELMHTGDVPDRLELPTGRIRQRVPMTSAVKVEGERLYRRAHRGERVRTPEREVEVHRAELLGVDGERAEFEIECSSGTYVRTLIETLGDAFCERLRRVAIGPFRVDEADGEPLALEAAMAFLPERALDVEEAEWVRHGRAVPATDAISGPARLTRDGRLLAVARRRDDVLQPEVVLA